MKIRNIKMNKKILTALAASTLLLSGAFVLSTSIKKVDQKVEALDKPTTINLKDTEEEDVRNYYSYLTTLPDSERRGTNLLKNLKYILVNNPSNPSKPAQYYSYAQVREIYQITDRNWYKSPAEDIEGYDSENETITGYAYNEDPYTYFYYRDDNFSENAHRLKDKVTSKEGTQQTLLNQEHIWSKSHGFSEAGGVVNAGTDLHHLVAADVAGNKWGHSNYAYGYVGTEASDWIKTKNNWDNGANAILNNKRGTPLNPDPNDTSTVIFEPRDEDKGDFARALLFMEARYNYYGHESEAPSVKEPNLRLVDYIYDDEFNTTKVGDVAYYGKLSDILEFHRNDPVITNSEFDFEVHRNNLIYENYQYTRNPFIDFPSWVELIWGDEKETGVADPDNDPLYGAGGESVTVPVTGVSLDTNSFTVTARSSQKVTATVSPSNASNKRVNWMSSDESVATVSAKGIVSGVSEGDAVITATTVDGGFTATVSVHVNPYHEGEMVTDVLTATDFSVSGSSYTSFTIDSTTSSTIYAGEAMKKNNDSGDAYAKNIQLNGSASHYIYTTNSVGSIRKIEAEFSLKTDKPCEIYLYGSDTPLTTPGNADLIQTISFSKETDEDGNIITHYEADVVGDYPYILISTSKSLNVNMLSFTWELPIPVTGVSLSQHNLSMDVGDTYTLVANVNPNYADNPNVSWLTSNSSVATVTNGLVTAKAVGSSTITVTTEDGGYTDTCVVTVNKSESDAGKISQTFSENGYENAQQFETINFYTDSENSTQKIDVNFTKGNKTYFPRYYDTGTAIRIYDGQTLTVASSLVNIVAVDFVFSIYGAHDDNPITSNIGTYVESAPTVATSGSWTNAGSLTSSVTFTVADSGASSAQHRKLIGMTITYYDSFAFAKEFLNETVCDDSGVNPPTVNWTSLSNKAAVLFDSDKTYLKEAEASKTGNKVEQAVARYDYIVGKYGTSSYSDFLLREPAPINHSGVSFAAESDNSIFIILLIAASSLSTMVLLVIKKKKKFNK